MIILLGFTGKSVDAQTRFGTNLLKKDAPWFHTAKARAIADTVIQYQSPQGGWPKSTDLAKPPRSPDEIPSPGGSRANSLDNNATTLPLQFLARMAHATGDPRYRDSFLKGVDYLLAAQYPSGGWPQFWPLRKGYYSHITFNDGAMIRVLELLRKVAEGEAPYDFVDQTRCEKAAEAVGLGIDCILKCQVVVDGVPTVWCAQHDVETLAPAQARSYEHPSLSGGESAGVLRFLMSVRNPTPEIVHAVHAGVEWFDLAKIEGYRYKKSQTEPALTYDPQAAPLWARFYEIESNRPIFSDRDGVIKYDIQEIGSERRGGYTWYGNWGEKVAKTYAEWPYREAGEKRGQTRSLPPTAKHRPRNVHHPRVIVSTDIGGTDPDDFQSMVHLLVYSDSLDLEGLISSPYGEGRTEEILDVIECYEADYKSLSTYSSDYPSPDSLRAITKQGEMERAPYAGVRRPTEGSNWIITCARRDDLRPLHLLVWGGLEDVAQALHDAPDILPKLRVYWIGGPNKKWSPDAYQYIVDHHPTLWMIESNATYRGWFTGGDQSGDWDNERFVSNHIKGKGALGDFFVHQKADIKMGDTPSVGWLLRGSPGDPSRPGWGGSYVRAWKRPSLKLNRLPKVSDHIEVFGILELAIPVGNASPDTKVTLVVENQRVVGHPDGNGTMRFRFSPKAVKRYSFQLESSESSLDGKKGAITVDAPEPSIAARPDSRLTNWWTDDLTPSVSEGPHSGAKTVSRWRESYLSDFARRMLRCQQPAPTASPGKVAP
ncbi:pectate lyase [Roseiconus lacunae]|uniref:pectate lyase n=1 Tax=Roseiconus lacunae TaxID=2605694 RepID=UPI001E512217|nr:pectate lyase [Roseiconus lacunae]MCD0459721.1 pectate lyase [Roseiconus lacunae]